jgi:hypothetical protein
VAGGRFKSFQWFKSFKSFSDPMAENYKTIGAPGCFPFRRVGRLNGWNALDRDGLNGLNDLNDLNGGLRRKGLQAC